MKKNKVLALLMAAMMTAGALAGCGGDGGSTSGDNSEGNKDNGKNAKLIYTLWGSEGVANPDIIAEINKKLGPDIGATLEMKYIDWGDTATKYPLMFSAGEAWDLSYNSPGTNPSYFTLASQEQLADITDKLDTVVPDLKAAIKESAWDSAKYKDRIYAVPCDYTEFSKGYGLVFRQDLADEWGVEPVTDFASMEAYFDAAKEHGMVPLNGDKNLFMDLYRMFYQTTDQWISVPAGISEGEMHLVATSTEKYDDVIHPAFTDEFVDWAKRMADYASKEYWPVDVLSAPVSAKDNFNQNMSAAYITHQPDWTGAYGTVQTNMPGVEDKTEYYYFPEANGKIQRTAPLSNATVINAKSENIDKALKFLEKIMTDESYYRLMQYGIEGRQYEVVDGVSVKPESYNADTDAGGFSAWANRVDKFNIPYSTEDPRRYTLNEEWEKVAIDDPFLGFQFDPANITTEQAAISTVNSQIGTQIMLGKVDDPVKAVEDYRQQLKDAGIDKVIEEVKAQLKEFTPIGK